MGTIWLSLSPSLSHIGLLSFSPSYCSIYISLLAEGTLSVAGCFDIWIQIELFLFLCLPPPPPIFPSIIFPHHIPRVQWYQLLSSHEVGIELGVKHLPWSFCVLIPSIYHMSCCDILLALI